MTSWRDKGLSHVAGLAEVFPQMTQLGDTLTMQLRHRQKRNLATHDWKNIAVFFIIQKREKVSNNISEDNKIWDRR